MATHPWRVVAELAASQHGVVTTSQAAEQGMTTAQVRTLLGRGVVTSPRRGMLVVAGVPPTWHQRLVVATLAGGGAAASHRASARLHGLLDPKVVAPVEVTVRRGRYPASDGVVVHRAGPLDECDVVEVGGIVTTNIARTLCDLGAVCTVDQVEQSLDVALRRGTSLRWIEQTLNRVDRPGPSGTSVLRRVLALPDRSGIVPESWRERVTERLLRHPELDDIVRQHEILGPDGSVIARPDFAVIEAKVGIEYHSDQWHFGPRRGRGDRRRDLRSSRVGWELLYLDSTDHASPTAAVEAVVDVVRLRRQLFAPGA